MQVLECSQTLLAEVVAYVNAGGTVFVDSGAFSHYRRAIKAGEDGRLAEPPLDFGHVLARYEWLATQVIAPRRLFVVAPDVVGDAAASLAALGQWRDRVRQLIACGVEVLVPIQEDRTGGLSSSQTYGQIARMLGTRDFRLAVPANAAAMSDAALRELCRRVRPSRLHLLGIAAHRKRLVQMVSIIRRVCPRADITCDANRLTAWCATRLARTQRRIETQELASALMGESRYTEIVQEIDASADRYV